MMKNSMSSQTAKYCTDNWRANTVAHYQYKLFTWIEFNKSSSQDPYFFKGKKVMDYLIFLFEQKKKPMLSIKAAYYVMRSLCNAAGNPISCAIHKQVIMLLNGMFQRRPPAPRRVTNDTVWDITLLLEFFEKLQCDRKLSLLHLGSKLACLILLASMHRRIDLVQLDIGSLSWNVNRTRCVFHLSKPTKTYNMNTASSRVEDLQTLSLREISFNSSSLASDLKICPVRCLKEYLRRTAALRQEYTKLFVITCDPYSPAKNGTLCRWVKTMMDMAGIGVLAYGPHSFRSAASSKAFECGLALSSIMKRAGWKYEGTFVKHYLKNVKQKIPGSLIDPPALTPMPPLSRQHGVKMGMKIKAEQIQISKRRNFAQKWNTNPTPPTFVPPLPGCHSLIMNKNMLRSGRNHQLLARFLLTWDQEI